MGRLERVLGLDTDSPYRVALWKRAVWHAVKRLVREYPRAALSAFGAATAYAVKAGLREGAEAIKEKLSEASDMDQPQEPVRASSEQTGIQPSAANSPSAGDAPECAKGDVSPHELSDAEKKKLLIALNPKARKALIELARKTA